MVGLVLRGCMETEILCSLCSSGRKVLVAQQLLRAQGVGSVVPRMTRRGWGWWCPVSQTRK